MESIEQVLEYVLGQSQFDLGHLEMVGGQPYRSWASRQGEVTSVHELRQLLSGEISDAVEHAGAREAKLVCPDATISLLIEHLRVFLNDFVDPENGSIGHAFPRVSIDYAKEATTFQADGLSAISCVTALDVFAKALVKGSALVGSRTVGSLLAEWVEGHPVRYRTCAILNGINIKLALEPVAGIRITPLPWSSDELPDGLPLLSSRSPEDYLGRTVIYLDIETTPPLFRPGPDGVRNPVQASSKCIADVDAVCEALALESDDFVDVAFKWNDFGELREIFPTGSSSTWARSGSGLRIQWEPDWVKSVDNHSGIVTVSPGDHSLNDLDEAELGHTIRALTKPAGKGTRIATSRFIKSKDSDQGLVDQFVDLRMALEALFLRDFTGEHSQEMRFPPLPFRSLVLGPGF